VIVAVVILSALLITSLAWSVIVTRRALAIDRTLLAGAEAVEDCLDAINVSYGVVGKIVQLPLATNDPKVIQIHRELKRVHGNLLAVATRLEKSWNNEEEEKVPPVEPDQE